MRSMLFTLAFLGAIATTITGNDYLATISIILALGFVVLVLLREYKKTSNYQDMYDNEDEEDFEKWDVKVFEINDSKLSKFLKDLDKDDKNDALHKAIDEHYDKLSKPKRVLKVKQGK